VATDPLLERLERALRHARRRFRSNERPLPQDGAAKLELAALITDFDALVRDLKVARASVRTQLDSVIAKTRAGDAYRRVAALNTRMPAGNTGHQGASR
jgi:hypothetical protein